MSQKNNLVLHIFIWSRSYVVNDLLNLLITRLTHLDNMDELIESRLTLCFPKPIRIIHAVSATIEIRPTAYVRGT